MCDFFYLLSTLLTYHENGNKSFELVLRWYGYYLGPSPGNIVFHILPDLIPSSSFSHVFRHDLQSIGCHVLLHGRVTLEPMQPCLLNIVDFLQRQRGILAKVGDGWYP
jgi:hypothetical protein